MSSAKLALLGALAAAILMIFVLLSGMVGISFAANEATKESHVGEGGVMAALDGEVVKTAESTVALPLYVAPILPVGERESLSVMTISYRDASMHDQMVEAGLIGENDTTIEYPTVEETVTVLSFKSVQRDGGRPRRRARGGRPPHHPHLQRRGDARHHARRRHVVLRRSLRGQGELRGVHGRDGHRRSRSSSRRTAT